MEWNYFKHDSPGTELVSKDEDSGCYYDEVPDFVRENGYLPIECRECFKGLVFWSYSRTNIAKFNRLLKTLPVSVHGKYNEHVVVFYFNNKGKMLGFLDILKRKMEGFEIPGRIQWRVSGRYWQAEYPQFFESAKGLKPIRVNEELTMKQWLAKR